jgi:hypothetical protein
VACPSKKVSINSVTANATPLSTEIFVRDRRACKVKHTRLLFFDKFFLSNVKDALNEDGSASSS